MTSRRVALITAGAGLAATALLLVLQTALLSLAPYEPASFSLRVLAFRVLFVLADGAVFAGLVGLARAEPAARPMSIPAAALAGFAFAAGLAGLASRLASIESGLHGLASVAEAAEPLVSLGTSVLVFFVLRALTPTAGRSRARVVLAIVLVSVGAALVSRGIRVFDQGPRGVVSAWLSFALEVARPAALAFFALSVPRAPRAGAPAAVEAGPYRAGAEPTAAPARVSPDLAQRIDGAIRTYRLAWTLRVGATAGTLFLVLVMMVANGRSVVVLALEPVLSAVASVFVFVGILRMRAVRGIAPVLGSVVVAQIATAVGLLADLGGAVTALASAASNSRWRAYREAGQALALSVPLSSLAYAVALLAVAGALGGLGDALGDARVRARALWTRSLVVVAAASFAGQLFALGAMRSGGTLGGLVVGGLGLAGFASAVGVLAAHLLLLAAVRRILAERATRVS